MRSLKPHGALCGMWLALLLAFAAVPRDAAAQTAYPNRTIRIVVGFAPGGGNDLYARIIAQKLQERLGQSVVVENRAGAGGRLASEHVMAAPADGYTLLLSASGPMVIAPAVFAKMNYATLKDFAPVSMFAAFPLILVVHPTHPATTVQELVAWLKANPDKANYGSSSPAFTLTTELFKLKTGAPGTPIPYKSSNESVVSVLGQQSVFTIPDPGPAVPQIKAGLLRALAVTTAARSEDLPDVPTMAEAGVAGVEVALWSGVFAPAGTPRAIVKKLEGEIMRMMQLPDVKEKFKQLATPTVVSTAEEFRKSLEAELKMWADVAKQANVKIE